MAEKNFKITGGLALGDYALTANGISLLWDSNALATEAYVAANAPAVNTNAIAESLASSTLYVDSGDNLNVNTNAFIENINGDGLYVSANQLSVNTNVIATKEYVDSVAQGLDVKASVFAATTENVNLASDLTAEDAIDGTSLFAGARILVKNQTTLIDNGIYVVSESGAPTRAEDANNLETDLTMGSFTFVETGTVNGGKGFVVTQLIPTGPGARVVWSQFSEAGSLTAGSNIYLDAGSINVNVNSLVGDLDGSGLYVSANQLAVNTNSIASNLKGSNLYIAQFDLAVDQLNVNTNAIAEALDGSGLYVSSNQLAVNVNALVGDLDANGYLKAVSGEVTLPGSGDFTITSSENIVLNAGAGLTSYLEAATAGNEIATHEYVTNALATVNTNAIAESLASSTLYVSDGDNLNVNVNAFVDTIDGSGLYVSGNLLAVNVNAFVGELNGSGLYVDGTFDLAVNTNVIINEIDVQEYYVRPITLTAAQYNERVQYDGIYGEGGGNASVTTDTFYATTATSNTYVTVMSDIGLNKAFTLDVFMSDAFGPKTRKSTISGLTGGASGAVEYTEYAIVDSATPIEAPDIFIERVGEAYLVKAKATLGAAALTVVIDAKIIDII